MTSINAKYNDSPCKGTHTQGNLSLSLKVGIVKLKTEQVKVVEWEDTNPQLKITHKCKLNAECMNDFFFFLIYGPRS